MTSSHPSLENVNPNPQSAASPTASGNAPEPPSPRIGGAIQGLLSNYPRKGASPSPHAVAPSSLSEAMRNKPTSPSSEHVPSDRAPFVHVPSEYVPSE